MKKKTVANIIMVAIIALIVVSGVVLAGNILGWFDSADGQTATLTDIRGIVHMHRDGVIYTVEKNIVLRPGDTLSCEKGATAKICVAEGYLTIGEGAQLTVSAAASDSFAAEISSGEAFASCTVPVTLRFSDKSVQIANASVHISIRTGTQTVSVFSGSVEQANAGQKLEYLNGELSVRSLQIDALNDFTIAQLRIANKAQTTHFTDAQLDELVAKRHEAMQNVINTQPPTIPTTEPTTPTIPPTVSPTEPAETTPPQTHAHEYRASVVAPSCTEGGYTEYTCACGDRHTGTKTAAKGHTWTDWVTQKEPTASAEGSEKRTCTNCDVYEERTLAKLPAGHTHSYTEKTVPATCTAGGYTLHTCSCGVSYKDNEMAATGHKYTDNVTASTCTAEGYTLHKCACGDSYTDSVTPATGHSWGKWKTEKEATTFQAGLQKRSCKACSATEEQPLPMLDLTVVGYVYITIRCDTILNNMDELNPAKAEFVPADGVILPRLKVGYGEGETVFDVLARVCNTYDIQLEYSWEPLYDAYYIEGINNLYHFDCSSESGWMYKVNEWFPNYGVSAYTVSDGDVIEFLYTCHGYGTDVGAPEWEG